MKNRPIFFLTLAGCVSFLIWAIYAWAGQITLTTYYPAPTGNYVNLTVTGNTYLATNSGNVGIRTSSPQAPLHVGPTTTEIPAAGTQGGNIVIERGDNNLGLFFGLNGAGNGWLQAQRTDFVAYNSILLNPNGGNVGIGVTGPVAKLDVEGGGAILGTNGSSSNTRTLTIMANGGSQQNYGAYPGAWTSALQLQSNDNSRGVWLSSLDSASGNNARLYAVNTGLDIYTGGGWGSNGTYAMTVASNGNVGIRNTNPGFTLTVSGTTWCTSGTWSGSDLRWKRNITTLDNPLERLLRLRGVAFDWRVKEFKANHFPENRQIGMIAQEMEKEFPQLIITDKEGYKAIAYDRFTAVLLEGIKSEKKQIDIQQKQLDAQQKEIENLRQEVKQLKHATH